MTIHSINLAHAHQAELRAVRRATRGSVPAARRPERASRTRTVARLLGLGAFAVSALVLATAATAAPGDPDPTFGTGGVAVVADGGSGHGIAVQPDGRVVGVGIAGGSTADGRAFRLNQDGSVDTTFGRRLLDVPGYSDGALAVAVQPDGKIVAAGRTSYQEGIAVWRLLPGGEPDTGFGGGDGVTIVSFGGADVPFDLAIAPDGRIVLAGSNDFSRPFVARLTATGEMDATFANGGRLIFASGTAAKGVAVQPDGKILVTGNFGAGDKVVLYRLTTTGSPDIGFGGGDGFTDTVTGQGFDVAVRPDGRIVVAGLDFRVAMYDGLVVRYQPGGDLDPTFGSAGQASVDLGGGEGFTGVSPTPDGGVVASGYTDAGGIVAKLDANGLRDPAFGLEGVRVLTGLTVNGVEDVVVGPGGTVVAIGTSAAVPSQAVVYRFQGSPPAPQPSPSTCHGKVATILGTPGQDRIRGTKKADVIVALGGNDKVKALGGNDLVCAGDGADQVVGGGGKDRLYGERGKDRLIGGTGRDRLVGGPDRDSTSQRS
jgi:uncharacterized delta-60 repeat protein